MAKHDIETLDIYTDFLLVSFGATTATGLARLLPEISHDRITRFLAQDALTDKNLWPLVKPIVRQIQTPEAVLIVDDTIQEKRYSDESELITWHYDHSQNRTVKGVNLLSALYFSQDTSVPVAFELIQKTMMVTDPKTGKDKWQAPQTKNQYAQRMMKDVQQKQIPFRYVLADSWY